MKLRHSLSESVGVLALGTAVALLSPAPCAHAQAPQAQEKQQAEMEKLFTEIPSVFDSGGEEGLKAWMRANKGRVPPELIGAFAEYGKQQHDARFLSLALVLAGEKGEKECLAYVYQCSAEYYFNLSVSGGGKLYP